MTRLIAFVFALLLTSAAQSAPVMVRDAMGREVVIPHPPQRIVAIFSSNVEILADLGLLHQIVGIEDMTRHPAGIENISSIGGRLGFSVEAIVRLEPDLVVITPARQAAHTLVRALETVDVPVLVLTHGSIVEVFENISLLGRATGTEVRAKHVRAGLETRLAAVAQCIDGVPRPTVFMETGRVGASGALSTPRADSYSADAIVRAGGVLAFPGLRATPQVSPEALLAANPDWILIAGTPALADSALHRPSWAGLRAVRGGRLTWVDRALFLIPGPRVVDGVEQLAATLHSDRPCARKLLVSAQ